MDAVSLLQMASAWLLNSGFAWLVGSWFARHWLQSGGMARNDAESVLRRSDVMAAGLCVTGSAAALWAATAAMGGLALAEARAMFWMMLSTTDYGHAGCITVLSMSVLLAVRLYGSSHRPSSVTALILLAAFGVTRASMGHAGAEGFWSVRLAAETVHLGGVGLWVGAVAVSGSLVLRTQSRAKLNLGGAGRYLDSMSRAAMCAVIAIVASGAYSAWHQVGTAQHLLHTSYGVTLLVKVGLVFVAIALGGYNKYIGLPAAAGSPQGLQQVRAVLQAETLVLMGVLAAAAILTAQQPPSAL